MRIRDIYQPGVPVIIGSYEVTAERITEFAKEFDPHFFHVDEEQAQHSLFGGLCASGWHVCAAAMQCNVANIQRLSAQLEAEGKTPPKLGPSPGISDLRWLKPVFAGDVVTFSMQFNHDNPVPTRPGRHVTNLTFEGVNQKNEKVMRFDCNVLEFD